MTGVQGGLAAARPLGRPRRSRRLRSALALALAAVLLWTLLDQLGVRRLSGSDFPVRDPLGLDLRAHVEQLASRPWQGRAPSSVGNAAAAHYLAEQLKAAGLLPLPSSGGYQLPLPAPPKPRPPLGDNVIGYLPGAAGGGGQAIVLGAHFDHIGETPDGMLLGADDNASSVAVLLGALRSLRERPLRHPLFVVFFNTEEAPFFGGPQQGSRVFMSPLPKEIGAPSSIRLAVVLDLIGGVVWRPAADTIFACGAEASAGLSAIVDGVHEDGLDVRRLGIHMVENLPGYKPQAFSDYDVFREKGVPFLFLSSGRTPRYHKKTDRPDTLYYDRMARTSRWIAHLVAQVDALDAPMTFTPEASDYATDVATMRWAIGTAAEPLRSIPGTSPITAYRLLGDRARLDAMQEPGRAFSRDDVLALERAGFRLQCLLYSYPVCFTL